MVWIRVDDTLVQEPFIGALADALGVDLPAAVGLWVMTALGFARYQKDGMVGRVGDTTLEQWAQWRGERGIYARAFRSCCVETADGQPDLPGVVKTWSHNESWLREQERKRTRPGQGAREAAQRPREGREDSAKESPGNSSAEDRGNDNDNGNGYVKAVVVGDARDVDTPARYAQRCVIACNTGLRMNSRIGTAFNELVASAQDVHRDWIEAGIDADVAERTILACAANYRPKGRDRQPGSLGYFDKPVRKAHEIEQARSAAPSGNLAAAVLDGDLTEGERLARDLTREVT